MKCRGCNAETKITGDLCEDCWLEFSSSDNLAALALGYSQTPEGKIQGAKRWIDRRSGNGDLGHIHESIFGNRAVYG